MSQVVAVKPTTNVGPPPIHRCGSASSSAASSVSDSYEISTERDMNARQGDGPSPCIAPILNKPNLVRSSFSPSPLKLTTSTTVVGPQPILLKFLLHANTTTAPINLGIEINLSIPIISYVHPTSPLLRHLHVGDILLELDGVRSTELDYRELHRWFHGRPLSSSSSSNRDGTFDERTLLFLPGRNSPYNPENLQSARFMDRQNSRGEMTTTGGKRRSTPDGPETIERNRTNDPTPVTAGPKYVDVLPLQKRPSSSSHDSTRQVFSRKSSHDSCHSMDDGENGTQEKVHMIKEESHCPLVLEKNAPDTDQAIRNIHCNESIQSGCTLYLDEEESIHHDEQTSSVCTPTRRICPRCHHDYDTNMEKKEMEEPISPSTTATTFSKSSEDGDDVVSVGGNGQDSDGSQDSGGGSSSESGNLDGGMGLPMTPDLESSSDATSNRILYPSSPLIMFVGPLTNSSLSSGNGVSDDDEVGGNSHKDSLLEQPCQGEDNDFGQGRMHTLIHDVEMATENVLLAKDSGDHYVETIAEVPLGSGPDEQSQCRPEQDLNDNEQEQTPLDQTQSKENSRQDLYGIVDALHPNNSLEDAPIIVVNNNDGTLANDLIDHVSKDVKHQEQIAPNPAKSDCEEEENWEKIFQQQRNRPSPNFDVIYVKLGFAGNCEEDISTIYGGKYNPSLHSTNNARMEDHLIGYMEEGQCHPNKLPIYDYNTLSQLTLGMSNAAVSSEQIDRETQARKLQLEEQDYLMKKARLIRLKRQHRVIEGIFAVLIVVAVGVLISILLVALRGKNQ
ncbi:hypothetical protein HJC23_013587 [Cyclotella cryptica]|uniref:PDZ domain-containing protein n=1 Tax=Cyclotella cryptica TaxID=29204 RepID=A0ABD3PQQ7_9STRA|eukprot:CCRYP_012316-RA/>CCRYP_012316-RA protein AED:0.11 eAED:0.11 QI:0/-1/0/1/-1/1/1/0/786